MTLRYFSSLALALLAGFIVVASQAFAPGPVAWLAFAAGIAFILAGAFMFRRPGSVHRALSAGIAVLGVLVVIESLLSVGSTVIWLSFAGAVGVLALALADLTVHELSTERVVHSLEVAPSASRERTGVAG